MKHLILKSKLMLIAIFALATTYQSKAQVSPVVSAFFGLDNSMPFQANFLCAGAQGMDGMPVNFIYPIDASTLSASDFEVEDSLGNIHIPMCAVLAPANENGENRTVLLIGEFGNATTSPPIEVRVVGDLFTISTLPGETACSGIINLNGVSTTNVVPLADGPSLFFAQRIDGNLNECSSGIQTIQVAWNGGITPHISGDSESDLFQYYIGYSDSSGVLIAHIPISIADINDNDNFHHLCFSTSDSIVKISLMANSVQDPNQDPNLYSEIDVSYCTSLTSSIEENFFEEGYKLYPNPSMKGNKVSIESRGISNDAMISITNTQGKVMLQGNWAKLIIDNELNTSSLPTGLYFITVKSDSNTITHKFQIK